MKMPPKYKCYRYMRNNKMEENPPKHSVVTALDAYFHIILPSASLCAPCYFATLICSHDVSASEAGT